MQVIIILKLDKKKCNICVDIFNSSESDIIICPHLSYIYTSTHISTSGAKKEQFYLTTNEFRKHMLKAHFASKFSQITRYN